MKKKLKTTPKKATRKSKLSLGEIYTPASKLKSMNVETPDSMFYEGQIALQTLQKFIENKFGKGTTIDEYVRMKLEYDSLEELGKALAAEQIDSVALAIYQIEKEKGIIVAHQTGIGKGRINAAIIRYAVLQGKKPIVITEKPSLFTDLYRDLVAIGSEDGSHVLEVADKNGTEKKINYPSWDKLSKEEQEFYDMNPDKYDEYCAEYPTEIIYKYQKNQYGFKKTRVKNPDSKKQDEPFFIYDKMKTATKAKGKHLVPFIVNARDAGTDIKDEQGNILYKAAEALVQKEILTSQKLPKEYDFILATYSQISSGNKTSNSGGVKSVIKGFKADFLAKFANNNILILDESHNASGGDSSTGIVMREMVSAAQGVIFLSATFAKRAENMALYGLKTDLSGANISDAEMATAVEAGGIALQEVISSALVSEGQLIRHERGIANTGAVVNWIILDKTAQEFGLPDYSADHRRKSDLITTLMNDIIDFQRLYVKDVVKFMDKQVKDEQGEVALNSGVKDLGVRNAPYFSKVFNIVSQMLLAIKADAVADRAIQRLKEGKKPVIAFANTMEAFIKELTGDDDTENGKVNTDFSQVLEKGLASTLKIQISSGWGEKEFKTLSLNELGDDAQFEYNNIVKKIRATTTGIMISPLDYVKQKIQSAGYTVGEVTGRSLEVIYDKAKGKDGSSTGYVRKRDKELSEVVFRNFQNNEIDCLMINKSGSTGKSAHAIVTDLVKAKDVKQRVMIVWQPELDINTEVQKRGRINRTGQILPPIYDYICSNIPAEQRLVMMLKAKLKSLDANTTSSQKTSKDLIQSQDFLNKYGDQVMKEFIYTDLQESGDNPLAQDSTKKSYWMKLDLDKYFKSNNVERGGKNKNNDAEQEKDETGKPKHIKDLARSVSGRVALLLTTEQEKFYDDVTRKYQEFVQVKIDNDEYDLEVETMDLKAMPKGSLAVAIVGKHFMDSPFSGPTYLGMYEINNLRKPFSVKELQEEVEAKRAKENVAAIKEFIAELLQTELKDSVESTTQSCERHIKQEQNWFDKLKNPTEEQREKLIENIYQEETERDDKIARYISSEKYQKQALQDIIEFFTVGRILTVPTNDDGATILGVCLGVKAFNKSKVKRLYDIEIQIAVATGIKKVNFALSGNGFGKLSSTKSYSQRMSQYDIYEKWQQQISSSSKDRVSGLVVTGNLLQAFANEEFQKGRLIDFTMQEGGVKKGILMPQKFLKDYIQKGGGENINVTVPVSNCLPVIRSLSSGSLLKTNVGLSIFSSQNGYFRFVIASNRKEGGSIYTNRDLLLYCEGNNFNSSSNNMVAVVNNKDLQKFCDILSAQHGVSVQLTPNQFKLIKQEVQEQIKEETTDEVAMKAKKMALLRLRAKALKIKALALSLTF